jgi:enterochelin esterase-like enzyme
MGNPSSRQLPIYLPPDYDPGRAKAYPVVFLLFGWTGRGASFLNDPGTFGNSLPQSLDNLIQEGKLPPVVVAFPDCTARLGSSKYINSAINGPFMDYLCDELVELVDRECHTHRAAEFRGVIGHSSGGFGALVSAMHRPDRFRYVCSSAADGCYEWFYVTPIPKMISHLRRYGGVQSFVERFLASPNPLELLPADEVMTMVLLSACTSFAPNPEVPVLRGDLYFDIETGELIPEIWEKFLAWDPVRMVDRFEGALRTLRWIHLESGADDEMAGHLTHRRISRKLRKLGIAHEVTEYPGGHRGHHHRMVERLRRMVERMAV